MDSFFNEIDSSLLLFLFLTILNKGENDTPEEKLEDRLETDISEPALLQEAICYIHKSSNRKRLKLKAVYF